MPININILGPQEDAVSTSSTSHASSSPKKKTAQTPAYSSSKADDDAAFLQSLASTSPERPRTATSITIRAPSPNLRSSSPPPSSHPPTIFSLSPRPLSPRQHRCPVCSQLFHSRLSVDDHHCSPPRTTLPSRPLTTTIHTSPSSSSYPLDFDISISPLPPSPPSPSLHTPSPATSSSHIYYRKLSDLNTECQRLQSQRDHLITAHQQHVQQLTAQWQAALTDVKGAAVGRGAGEQAEGGGLG